MRKFNAWFGDKLASWLSTMACFYLISVVILATLFFQRPQGLQSWLLFWVTVFFQGVALPVLGYVSKKSGDIQEKVLRETHDIVMEELRIVRKELELAHEERRMLRELLHDIKK